MSKQLSHAEHLEFLAGTPQPRIHYGGGILVPVLQMGRGVSGLEKLAGSDHSVVGLYTPRGVNVHANEFAADPDEAALSRQELVRQRLDILGDKRPQL